jgi:hypothetical protein
MLEAFLYQRGNHPGHIGRVDTDSLRLAQSIILKPEGKTHADTERFVVGPVS